VLKLVFGEFGGQAKELKVKQRMLFTVDGQCRFAEDIW